MKCESSCHQSRLPRRTVTKVVLFDGRCSLCRRSRAWAARLDWLGTVNWISFRDLQVRAALPQLTDEQLEKEMWVVTAKGEMLSGFPAWRHIVTGLPLTFLPALLLYVPPIPFIGKRVYAFIAARRPIACETQPSAPVPGGAWETILRRASMSASARGPRRSDAAAAVLLQLLICLAAMALASCSQENRTATTTNRASDVVKFPTRGGTISVVSVGDILLGSSSAKQLATNGYDWPFERVRPLLGNADLVLGNLAAPITASEKKASEKKDYSYKLSTDSALALKRAGFHALSLGNSHVLDYGVTGMLETISALRTNNIGVFGAGESEQAARHGLVCDFGTLRLGLLGYGDETSDLKTLAKGKRGGYALLAEKNLAQDIAEMRKRADVVVVSLHWGKNYKDVTESQQKMGRRAVELGADIVYGHHPHIAQGIEIHKGKPIIYSLGNFVFGTKGRFPDAKQGYGLVSRWIFEGKTLQWIATTPIAVNNELVDFQPRRVPAEEARQALEPHLKRYGTQVRWEADTAFIGFGSKWENAALPRLPWQEKGEVVKTASATENVPGTANK